MTLSYFTEILSNVILKADDDVNRAYSKFETSLIEIIDKHIPIKKRKPVAYPVPYMNQNLRNLIYKKKMLGRKYGVKFTFSQPIIHTLEFYLLYAVGAYHH
jgi:hypothetical protein